MYVASLSNLQELRAVIIPEVVVMAGRTTSFFLESDQNFRLPFAMYPNDPSLYMAIPAAGIKPQTFTTTTRVNKEAKRFTTSQISYGLLFMLLKLLSYL